MELKPRVKNPGDPANAWYSHTSSPIRHVEVFGFRGDTAYDNNFGARVLSAAERCVAPLLHSNRFANEEKMPPFNEELKVRVTLEILPEGASINPDEFPAAASTEDPEVLRLQAELKTLQAALETAANKPTKPEDLAKVFLEMSDEDKTRFTAVVFPDPIDARRAELDAMVKKDLLPIAASLKLEVTERTSNPDIINAILKAEFPEG